MNRSAEYAVARPERERWRPRSACSGGLHRAPAYGGRQDSNLRRSSRARAQPYGTGASEETAGHLKPLSHFLRSENYAQRGGQPADRVRGVTDGDSAAARGTAEGRSGGYGDTHARRERWSVRSACKRGLHGPGTALAPTGHQAECAVAYGLRRAFPFHEPVNGSRHPLVNRQA